MWAGFVKILCNINVLDAVVTLAGIHSDNENKTIGCRTPENTPVENSQENSGLSNHDDGLPKDVTHILRCIAALDEYDVYFLASELSPDDDELEISITNYSCDMREVYGCRSLIAEVAEEYRRNRGGTLKQDGYCDLPDFDDPDWDVKVYTDSAPIEDRKKLFVRLWQGFREVDRKSFLSRVDPHGVFHRCAA